MSRMCLCVCICTYRWCCAVLCGSNRSSAPAMRGSHSSDLTNSTNIRPPQVQDASNEVNNKKESTRDLALGVTKEVLELWKNKKTKSKETKDVEETSSKKKVNK
ncbi:uncharacterized protein LOC133527739 [Cydia pomonella]|uniref:uncharacterized protein LOC133527739 n=1 Tax=Cydia pomonella TaxID=82600 RepID=UPI002ADE7B6F|nr:uncharacterized protein LOC133527739 [Cydia pomonella]